MIDKSGNKVEQTDWHHIEMWDALARNAEKVLRKGRTVFIEGKIKNETWTDKDGNKRSAVRIRALQFQVVSATPGAENPGMHEKNGNLQDEHNDNGDSIPF